MNSSQSELNELEAEYAKINRYLHEHGINADPLKDYESILAARDRLYETSNFKEKDQFESSPPKAYTNKLFQEHSSKKKNLLRPSLPQDQNERMSRLGSGSAKRSERSKFGDRSQFSPSREQNLYDKLRSGNYNYEQTKQMLLSRQRGPSIGKKTKRKSDAAYSKHYGKVSNLQKQNKMYQGPEVDRNKIYSVRAEVPINIPINVFDIPGALQKRFDDIGDDEVIFESQLMKYKPGIRLQYMARWCQVTKTHFLYFSEGVPYASYLGRPLCVIPINRISSVKRVMVDVPEKSERVEKLKNFQFEIFVKSQEEWERDLDAG